MMAWIMVVSHAEFEAEKNFVPQADNILQEGEFLFKRNRGRATRWTVRPTPARLGEEYGEGPTTR